MARTSGIPATPQAVVVGLASVVVPVGGARAADEVLLGTTETFAVSAQLTGTLTLNVENKPNVVVFFNAGSTLSTASNSYVVPINGAQATTASARPSTGLVFAEVTPPGVGSSAGATATTALGGGASRRVDRTDFDLTTPMVTGLLAIVLGAIILEAPRRREASSSAF